MRVLRYHCENQFNKHRDFVLPHKFLIRQFTKYLNLKKNILLYCQQGESQFGIEQINNLKNQFSIQMILVIVLIAMSSVRADYESGQQAWDAGRPADALIEWRAAAEAGDRRAMLALGRLFVKGLGTPQNYIDAHMWFNLAASRGEIAAIAERDALEKKMTTANLAEAQKRASNWQPNKNQVGEAPEEAEQDASPPQPDRDSGSTAITERTRL